MVFMELLKLYLLFFKVGLQTFGGGYSMLPVLQKKFVNKYHIVTDEEMLDYFTIGGCTPGVISVNISTFIGYKKKGVLGGIVATLGMVTPSFLIILLISIFLQNVVDFEITKHALAGIRIATSALIFSTFTTLYKKSIIDNKTFVIFLTVVIFGLFTSLKPIYLVLYSGILGVILAKDDNL
jgi:chromate transporter